MKRSTKSHVVFRLLPPALPPGLSAEALAKAEALATGQESRGGGRSLYLLLALGLALLAGCATGGKAARTKPVDNPPVLAAKFVPPPTRPSVGRLTDGREGFVIREPSNLDSGSRADFEQANAMLKGANYQKSVELLEKVIARSPGLTAPHINIANAYNHLNRPEQAEQHLKAALEAVPGHPVASNDYGLLLRKAGRFAEARVAYEKSLAAFPEYHPVERNLAILCDLYLKDLTCAQEHYETYSKAMPKDKQVRLWIADLQTRTGHLAMHTGPGQ